MQNKFRLPVSRYILDSTLAFLLIILTSLFSVGHYAPPTEIQLNPQPTEALGSLSELSATTVLDFKLSSAQYQVQQIADAHEDSETTRLARSAGQLLPAAKSRCRPASSPEQEKAVPCKKKARIQSTSHFSHPLTSGLAPSPVDLHDQDNITLKGFRDGPAPERLQIYSASAPATRGTASDPIHSGGRGKLSVGNTNAFISDLDLPLLSAGRRREVLLHTDDGHEVEEPYSETEIDKALRSLGYVLSRFAGAAVLVHVPSEEIVSPVFYRVVDDFWSSLCSGGPSADGTKSILISKMADVFANVCTGDIAAFVPGHVHLGKPFIFHAGNRRHSA